MSAGPPKPSFGLSPEQKAKLEALMAQEGLAVAEPTGVMPRSDAHLPARLSTSQERIWFLEELAPGTCAYNVPAPFHLEGPLDVDALREAIREVGERHELLRATYVAEDDGPRQVVAAEFAPEIPLVDLRDVPEEKRFTRAVALANEDYRRPFDLRAGPLFRATIWKLDDEEHLLLLALHHIISDGGTLVILSREIEAIYEARLHGEPSPLAAPELQYADFAAWQRRWLESDEVTEQLAWWKERLAVDLPALELPTDRARTATQTLQGSWFTRELPRSLVQQIDSLANVQRVSPFMVFLAAFQTLLHRITGAEEIAVGSPVGMRDRTELAEMPGFFVNTLAHRTEMSGAPSFSELLGRTRSGVLDAFAHQNVPFERVVNAVSPDRDLSRTPLFQVMYNHRMDVPRALQLAGLRGSRLLAEDQVHSGTSKVDLALYTEIHDGGAYVSAEYATALFDEATIERMLERFEVLLGSIVENPEASIADLVLLPEQEAKQLTHEWNDTRVDYPHDETIPTVIARRAHDTPDAVAIEFGPKGNLERITYGELNARANRLAHHLRELGVAADDRVALCAERSSELIVALLGILKAGAAYVPLDPNYPAERLAFMLEDCGAKVLITEEGLVGEVDAKDTPLVRLDTDRDAIAAQSVADFESGAAPRSAAYVIYTSGSTGTPKGVAVPHQGVLRLIFGNDWLQLDETVRMIHLAPFSFDASILDIWGGLLHGGCIVPFPERVPSIELLRREIDEHAINTLFLTTALFNTVVDEAPEILESIGQVATGGEAMSLRHVRRAQELLPHLRITNCYGPTETSVIATRYVVPNPLPDEVNTIPIGTPIGNTTVHVLDARMRPMPIGVPGELYVGGPGVALGYLGRPDLTAQSFVADPFADPLPGEEGARLYRTGDLVRRRADGNVEFLGRNDDQVKIRGHRIELGEIEAILGTDARVRQVLAMAIADDGGQKRIVAYVVPETGASVTPASLEAELRDKCPEYMVPSAFVILDTMPLTAGGKVDRRALPEPDAASVVTSEEHIAPRNETEGILAAQWAQVLKVERVGVHDDFFRLGGHSLMATILIARIRKLFGVDLPLESFFRASTLGELAKVVDAARAGAPGSALPPLERHEDPDGRHPLSLNQKGLWYVQRLTPDNPFYNVPVTIEMRGRLDASALEKSLGEIVRRHESLRTVFRIDDRGPYQQILPAGEFTLSETTVVGIDLDAATVEHAAALACKKIDLEQGPVFRALLIRRSETDAVLAISVHHLVFDGWSMDVFLDELTRLYAAFAAGEASPLAELPIQFSDFARWQRERLSGDAWDEELSWWRVKLDGAPFLLELPTDRPRPPVQTYVGSTVTHPLDDELARGIRALARESGTTVYMTLLAAAQAVLRRYTHQSDFTIGTPVAGRSRAECEGAIGLYLNIVPLRANLAGDPRFSELLGRVREETLAAHAHQDFPFESLVEALQPDRDLAYTPIYQVLYSLRTPARAMRSGEVEFAPPGEIDTGTSKTDLAITVDDDGTSLAISFNYNTDLFDETTMQRMGGHFRTLLASAVADPTRTVSKLPLLTTDEEHRILEEWSGPTPDYPRDAAIGTLFSAQARRRPDAVALVLGSEEISYRVLDERSNQVANLLLSLGVGRGDRVTMCLDRSIDVVVCILGILKAGAAYVPLDPAYPNDRLAFMMEDTASPVLLVHAGLLDSLPETTATTVRVDEERERFDAQSTDAPSVAVHGDDPAYVMYTSGSTGKPKGVVVPHRGPVRLVHEANFATIDEERTFLLLAPISFDASTLELWGALLRGGRLVIYAERIPTSEDLERVVTERGVTTVWLTAALFNSIVDERPRALASLREILTGGEALSVAHIQRAHRELPATVQLINGYGPTENTTFTCCHWIPRDLPDDIPSIPIGTPISNTKVYLLDEAMQPVPQGVPGELMIGGDGLACGYLDREELTAERFIANPFGEGRLYRTGDLVRWLDGGLIEFLGRNDDQVKIRGHRIELGEVQAILGEHEGVLKAYVTVHEDATAGKRMIAYVVGRAEHELGGPELVAFLGERLPDYMVPAAFTFLDDLPINANGKIDRQALPAPDFAAQVTDTDRVAPRSEVEGLLAEIWERVLGVESIGVEDDFFELGGHSLLAVTLLAQVNDIFGQDLPLTSLITTPTIASQAQAVYAGVGGAESSALVKIKASGTLPPVFCVCSLGGTVLNQRPLAMRLGEDQPFFGLQAINLDEELGRPAKIEEYAARYLEAMREVWPDGPYIVGGHSFGGIVSYEIARQLIEQGQEVAMMFILDSALPNLGPSTLGDRLGGFWAFLRGVPYMPGEMLGRYRRSPEQFRLAFRQKLHFVKGRLTGRKSGPAEAPPPVDAPRAPAPDAPATDHFGMRPEDIVEMSHWPENNRRIARRHWAAVLAYQPETFPGTITLFRSRLQSPFLGLGLKMGWERVARDGVEVSTVPGGHLSILDPPHVDVLAAKFAARIRACLPRT